MKASPEISIIIPVYNAALYLKDCIESLLGQSYGNFELLLINDGSTDDSSDICHSYARTDSRIIVIDKTNGGVSSARNAGLEAAHGKWIIFCDADDYYLPDAIRSLYSAATREENTDFALGMSRKIDGHRISNIYTLESRRIPMDGLELPHLALWAYIFRHSIIRDNKIRFEESISYSEDKLFIFSFAIKARFMATIDKAVYAYRIVPTSACQSKKYISMAAHQFRAASMVRKLMMSTDSQSVKERLSAEASLIEEGSIASIASRTADFKVLGRLHELKALVSPTPAIPFYASCLAKRAMGVARMLKKKVFS